MNGTRAALRSSAWPIAVFAGAAGAVIAVVALLLARLFGGPGASRTYAISGGCALCVQMLTYGIARWAVFRPRRPIMTAWAVGMVVRFGAVVLFATVALPAWRIAATPALLSFVIFLFVSTLLEPWLLRS
jgi:hypothetical protein